MYREQNKFQDRPLIQDIFVVSRHIRHLNLRKYSGSSGTGVIIEDLPGSPTRKSLTQATLLDRVMGEKFIQ